MTLSLVSIEPLKDLTDWYKLSFVSMKNYVGETKVEILCSAEALRQFRQQIDKAIGEKARLEDYPETLRKFMEGDK